MVRTSSCELCKKFFKKFIRGLTKVAKKLSGEVFKKFVRSLLDVFKKFTRCL
jgi:hypothetical protein